jgi:uncharacterized protein
MQSILSLVFKSMMIIAMAIAFSCNSFAVDTSLASLPFTKKLQLAKAGDPDAKMAVGEAYELGMDIKADLVRAAKWYREAALIGNLEAQFRLAKLVIKGAPGMTADKPTAIKLLQAGSKQGHAASQNLLGLMLQNGDGIAKDEKGAVELYKKAAEQNLAVAETNLGVMYLKGVGVERNLDEAFKLFERGARDGDGWAMNNLGGMYEMGWGTPKDLVKAKDYYSLGAAKGIAMATQNMARLTAPAGATATIAPKQ